MTATFLSRSDLVRRYIDAASAQTLSLWLPRGANFVESAYLTHVPVSHEPALCISQTTVDWDAELKKLNSKKVKGVSDAEVSMLTLKRKV